jgi:hypothetical protein
MVGFQVFRGGKGFRAVRESSKARPGNRLDRHAFYKIGGGKPAAPACPTRGRQDVIAARNIVTERLRTPRAQENRAGRTDSLNKRWGSCRKTQVFWRKAIDEIARGLD